MATTATIWTTIEDSLNRQVSSPHAQASLAGLPPDTTPSVVDRWLVDRFNEGVPAAAALLALRHLETLRAVARRAHVDPWEWPDHTAVQVQLTMTAFYQTLADLDSADDVATAIYWKTLNLIRRHRGHRGPIRDSSLMEIPVDLAGTNPLPDDLADHDGPRRRTRPLVHQLCAPGDHEQDDDITVEDLANWARRRTDKERRALELLAVKFMSDTPLSARELALHLGLSEDGVESQVRRARSRLRAALTDRRTGLFADASAAA
ncbi:sigma-70 family RNA polymerase sigma factor [Nocardia altamirensis]|uniref:sigma-70 family RNA polymerase sigma factor n=1 Tax=Nocardia altamirensis TaxID=472158 RepID=UPI00084035DD|nr:sigma-70 family RNA polymerase sigma factor [Nocardia altamirensis]